MLYFIFVSHYYSHWLLWLFQFVSLSARDNMLPHLVMGWQPQQWHHNRQLTFADTVQWAYILCSLPSSLQFGSWIKAVRASRGHDWRVQIFTALLWAESTVWPRAERQNWAGLSKSFFPTNSDETAFDRNKSMSIFTSWITLVNGCRKSVLATI